MNRKGMLRLASWALFMVALLLGVWNFTADRQPIIAHEVERELDSKLSSKPMLKLLGNHHIYRFIAFGDWGAGTPFQKDVAKQMNALYERQPFDSALLLGDNIYEDGNIKKHAKAYFTDMYAPLIKGGVNFIVAIGNHDVRGGYENDQRAFFRMPGFYYLVKKPHVDIFVINTNSFTKDEIQQKWLSKVLGNSKARWKIVMGHYPVYTSGEHGSSRSLMKTLEPVLIQHHVDLYLAGHDHDYERFKPIQGVTHIVSGGGGAYLRGFEKPETNSLIRIKAHHFLSFEAKEESLKMQAIDKTGKIIDQTAWSKELPKIQKRNLSAL